MKRLALFATVGAVIISATPALADYARVIDYQPVLLGQGWITAEGRAAPGVCLEFSAQSETSEGLEFKSTRVTDHHTMATSLAVSAEQQVKSVIGNTKVSRKASFSRQTAIDEFSLVFSEHIRLDTGYDWTAPAPISQAAAATAAHANMLSATRNRLHSAVGVEARRNALSENLKGSSGATLRLNDLGKDALKKGTFQQTCGDTFISAIYKGGEFVSEYRYSVSSRSEQDRIAASLGFKTGVIVTTNTSVSLAAAIKQASQTSSLSIKYLGEGGENPSAPATLDEIQAHINAFPPTVRKAPKPYQMQITDYKSIQQELPTINPAASNMERHAFEYARAELLYDTASTIASHVLSLRRGELPEKSYVFGRWGYNLDQINSIVESAQSRLTAERSIATTCAQSPGSCPEPTPWQEFDLRRQLPLPVDGLDQEALVRAMFARDDFAYRDHVIDNWIRQLNAARCALYDKQAWICAPLSDIDALAGKVVVGTEAPRFTLVSTNNSTDAKKKCLAAKDDGGSDATITECPGSLNRNEKRKFFVWQSSTLRPGPSVTRCMKDKDWQIHFRDCNRGQTTQWDIAVSTDKSKLGFALYGGNNCVKDTIVKGCNNDYWFKIDAVIPVSVFDAMQ